LILQGPTLRLADEGLPNIEEEAVAEGQFAFGFDAADPLGGPQPGTEHKLRSL
jgi:hypothetical protein